METEAAVFVKNAFKNYGKKEILKDFCMQVPRGSIYGLLGASGCGKTTLLSCIVGLKKFDSGEIWVLGGKPRTKSSGIPGPKVGYMPQDVALVGAFTIKEMIFYFGRMLHMEEAKIEKRFEELSILLDLPSSDSFIINCSGGQQRRISFAAALVHSPDLLILDEPTVGLDPVLRESIWKHLVELTQKGKVAVIITTHYIEEAKQANTIGLMRQGCLLAEDSPSNLLTSFGTTSLEDVFLTLSQQQEAGVSHYVGSEYISMVSKNSSLSSITSSKDFSSTTNMFSTRLKKSSKPEKEVSAFGLDRGRLKAMLYKNWIQFFRNLGGIAFLLFFPILETACFLLAVGGDVRSINVAIVDKEITTTKCDFTILNTTATPDYLSGCHLANVSCRFLKEIDDPMINLIYFDELSSAQEAVKHGNAVAILYMAENFTESYEQRINLGSSVGDENLEFGQIKAWMDMSNRQIGMSVKKKLYNLFMEFQKKLFADCNYPEKFAEVPIRFNWIYGNEDESYNIFMVPGMLVTMVYFLSATMTSTILIEDRMEGIWDRSNVAGATSLEIILTHFAVQSVVAAVQLAEIIIILFAIARNEVVGSLTTIAFLTFIQSISGMSWGLWVSTISSNFSMANIVATGSFFPMLLLCGLMWPLEGMGKVLRFISRCLPYTIAIESVRNVMKKGMSIMDFEVLNGAGIGLMWFLIFSLTSVFIIKSKR